MLKQQATAQQIEPSTITANTLRKLAVNAYRHAGGGDSGMRDYFGFALPETTNKKPFLHNSLID